MKGPFSRLAFLSITGAAKQDGEKTHYYPANKRRELTHKHLKKLVLLILPNSFAVQKDAARVKFGCTRGKNLRIRKHAGSRMGLDRGKGRSGGRNAATPGAKMAAVRTRRRSRSRALLPEPACRLSFPRAGEFSLVVRAVGDDLHFAVAVEIGDRRYLILARGAEFTFFVINSPASIYVTTRLPTVLRRRITE